MNLRLPILLSVFVLIVPAVAAEPEPKKHPANHLARESSPYLLQHAHNPVDWYPWGEEAFAKAKKEGKMIFLSIGYSSCHWCHVMEKESFANEDVAKIMNEHFVCIKVDREERPDVDHIYMTALNAMGNRGGWPMSMFLTAEGKPFYGGTYWPREDKEVDGETFRGFKSRLKAVHEAVQKEPKEIDKSANEVAEYTEKLLAGRLKKLVLVDPDRDLVDDAVRELKGDFDKIHGGFGNADRNFRGTKFPQAPCLRLLQTIQARAKDKELDEVLEVTLDKMALGGIYDHLGGGFARYSTERTWTVPHFEKMLYDNAQLTEVYSVGFKMTRKPLYKKVIQETLAFVQREMTSPEGAFYSALDADSEGHEGKFYIWAAKEIDAVLTDKDDADFFKKLYGADKEPNFEEKYFIFRLNEPLDAKTEARVQPLRQKLFEVRAKRERPFLDTKVLTSWNGLMIAGYAVAGRLLDEPKYTETAVKAADFILKTMKTKDGRLLRTYGAAPGQKAEAKLNGYLDDYAGLIHGLLELHETTNDKKWLDEAKSLMDVMLKFHGDKDAGGFFFTAHDHEKLFARAKDQYDGAQSSGNSLTCRNLIRLSRKTGEKSYQELAEKTFKTFAGLMKDNPGGSTTMAEALSLFLDGQKK
jgi:hypothetical protein